MKVLVYITTTTNVAQCASRTFRLRLTQDKKASTTASIASSNMSAKPSGNLET